MFDDLIDELVNRFKEKMPITEKNLDVEFKKYLKQIRDISEGKPDEEIRDNLIQMANFVMNISDTDAIKRNIIFDENFEIVRMLSGKIFREASRIIEGNEKQDEEIDIKSELKKIETALKGVQSFNIEQAKTFYSEATLDAKFIENPSTNIMSFRLGHKYASLRENKEDILGEK